MNDPSSPGGSARPRETVTLKVDKEFETGLAQYIRDNATPQTAQSLAAHFSRPLAEVEHYLGRLDEQKRIKYVYVGGGLWHWIHAPATGTDSSIPSTSR